MTICDDCNSIAPAFKPSIEDGNPFGEFFFVIELNKERVIVRFSDNKDLCVSCIKERAIKIFDNGKILNSYNEKDTWLGLKRK